jgi:GntR family transcriptional regulator, vanillate catabolism transcriptional regulator
MSERRAVGLKQLSGLSLADQAQETIRTAILSGQIPPDERLTIESLALELGISRTPVREALKALESDGLVRLAPYRGVFVEPWARAEVFHRYGIRAMLEGYAAELACERDAEGCARQLEENCAIAEGVAAAADSSGGDCAQQLAELNQDFHRIIREASGSQTLIRILVSLRNPQAFTLRHWGDPERRQSSLAIHREIADSFRQNKPKLARTLAERHLLEARDQLLGGARDAGPDTAIEIALS